MMDPVKYVSTFITLDAEELDLLGVAADDREDLDVVNDAVHSLIYNLKKEKENNNE